MHRRRAGTALAALVLAGQPALAAASSCMDGDPQAWLDTPAQRALYTRLGAYLSCPDHPVDGPLADRAACNYFVGKVLQEEFGVDDFVRPTGGWLTANEIAAKVAAPQSRWRSLGPAASQAALRRASEAAGEGAAVIAVSTGSPGHVALVLPGALRRSGNWKLDVPNSASFSLGAVEKAYVFCRLSYAFGGPEGVTLYRRES
ncbi:hypothetical protein [Pelagerythrobacter marinus]|jgi:hypothetical protein|uniref:hypothetical protein n=1 Tax=Pelagerythrobacter marinus TaxID=538382 RepID=UPI002036B5A8|nr:hypothetical protein [Pelagerythrobacter marinus]USA39464.1 hypothetical protein NCF86_14435 [Pelagerythrobacter marinus]WPZ06396.1 hypothetical protein T8T98_13415 [Pelagerythrobacter marinus]